MTKEEIKDYVHAAIEGAFDGFTTESGEIMTGKEGDGRFFGKVVATRYQGLGPSGNLFLAIGKSEQGVQIVKLGRSECLTPDHDKLDAVLLKELGISKEADLPAE